MLCYFVKLTCEDLKGGWGCGSRYTAGKTPCRCGTETYANGKEEEHH